MSDLELKELVLALISYALMAFTIAMFIIASKWAWDVVS